MAAKKSARAAWGSITRDAIVDAATQAVVSPDSGELSIRSLAATLEVSPMALYRHVENKEDLLDEVVGRLLADRWRPSASKRNWRVWITEAADRLRAFLVEQPAALQVYLRRPVVSSSALERMDACVAVLSSALGDAERAHGAYAAIQTYTIGFAALEAGREASPVVVADDATASLRELASYATPAQFRVGIGYLIQGIGAASEA